MAQFGTSYLKGKIIIRLEKIWEFKKWTFLINKHFKDDDPSYTVGKTRFQLMGCLVGFVSDEFVILMSPRWGVEPRYA